LIVSEFKKMLDSKISRRRFFKLFGHAAASTALIASGPSIAKAAGIFDCESTTPSEYILLENGLTYINGHYTKCDLLLRSGTIAAIDRGLSMRSRYGTLISQKKVEIIDCTDFYISPGWVDMHCHIGGTGLGLDYLGAKMGVTALVDAGTYGPQTFNTFLTSYYNNSTIPLFCFLNVRKDGIKITNMFSNNNPGVEDVDGAAALCEKYPHIIIGLKSRSDKSNTSDGYPTYLADITARLGKELQIPVMYHLGDPDVSTGKPVITDYLKNMKSGDIITHCLRKTTNCILTDEGMVRPEVLDAKHEGVIFDVGHGLESFMFQTAERAFDQDFDGFSISSDLHALSFLGKALTFANVASKFLALGMGIDDITGKISTYPRQLLNLESSIAVNKHIDLTIFSIAEGNYYYFDASSKCIRHHQRIYPEYTIINGTKIRAGYQDRLRWPV